MSGNLAELVVEIAANMSRFQNDMRQANTIANTTMQKMQGDVSRAVGAIESSFATVSKAFGAITAVAAGGAAFAGMINATRAWTGEVVKLSKAMGSSLADASAYNVALRLTGQDADTALLATTKLTKTLTTNKEAFAAHGIAIRDSSGKLLAMPQIITNTFEALSKLKSGTDRNTAAQELLGKSFLQLSSMAKINNAVLTEAKDLSEALGLTVDGKTAEAVKKYGYEMNKLKLVHEAFKVNVGETVLPALVKIETAFNNVALAAAKMKSKGGMAETFTVNLASLTLMEQRLNSKEFLLHPIDTVTKLTADLHALKVAADKMAAKNAPADAQTGGGNGDPTSAADRKAAAAAAKAAIEAQRQHYNAGVTLYNGFIDDLTRNDPTLDAHSKRIAEIQNKINDAAKEYPELAADIRAVGKDMLDQAEAAKKLAVELANLKTVNMELEGSIKDMATDFAPMGKGLGGGLQFPQIGGTLGKDGSVAGAMPKFSLTGADQTGGLYGHDTRGAEDTKSELMDIGRMIQSNIEAAQRMQAAIGGDNYGSRFASYTIEHNTEAAKLQSQYAQMLISKEQFNKEMLRSDQVYATQKKGMGLDMLSDSLSLAQKGFQDNKAMSAVILAAEAAVSIARIMMNAEVAKSAALASAMMLGPLGPAAAAAAIAPITAMETFSIGMVVAATAMEGMQVAGARALGGPVRAGETYLVGEHGPELMTAGADGFITPNDRLGGASVTQHITIDARGADAGVEMRIHAAMQRAKEEAKAEVYDSMRRGGQFSTAPRR